MSFTQAVSSAVACVLLAACATPRAPAAREAGADLVIREVTVVDVSSGELLPGRTVLIRGGRIVGVEPTHRVRVPVGAQVADGRGKYLIPGLWDMHTHSLNQRDLAFPLHVANGVTGIRDLATSLPLADLRRLRTDIAAGRVTGPRFVAAGPLIDGPGSTRQYLSVRTADEASAAVDSLHREGADFIKVYDRLPRDAFLAIVETAARQGLPVVGHIPESFDDPAEAYTAGMRSIEHAGHLHLLCAAGRAELMRLVWQADTLQSGGDESRARALMERAGRMRFTTYSPVLCEAHGRAIAERGTWLTPTLTLEFQSGRPPVHMSVDSVFANPQYRYVPQATLEAWRRRHAAAVADTSAEERARAREEMRQTLSKIGIVHRAGVGILAGTDGSASFQVFGFNLHEELAWLVQAGLTPLEALRAATLNPARFLNASDSLGTIAPGKLADLVLLDANPLEDIRNTTRIRAVVLNGRVLSRADLDRLLDAAVAAAQTPEPPRCWRGIRCESGLDGR